MFYFRHLFDIRCFRLCLFVVVLLFCCVFYLSIHTSFVSFWKGHICILAMNLCVLCERQLSFSFNSEYVVQQLLFSFLFVFSSCCFPSKNTRTAYMTLFGSMEITEKKSFKTA